MVARRCAAISVQSVHCLISFSIASIDSAEDIGQFSVMLVEVIWMQLNLHFGRSMGKPRAALIQVRRRCQERADLMRAGFAPNSTGRTYLWTTHTA